MSKLVRAKDMRNLSCDRFSNSPITSGEAIAMRGFSLVELSIVLVILGLLTGGILAGQSLIRAAELRGVSTDNAKLVAALYSFRDRYFHYPGDMPNAAQFWGAADGNDGSGSDCRVVVSNGPATCNGDGNGLLADATATLPNEMMRYWQHLANAGLIEGSYTGVQDGTNTFSSTPGVNVMRGRMSNSGYAILFGTGSQRDILRNGNTAHFTDRFGDHTLIFGAAVANNRPLGAIATPQELWNIDTKLDDGKPGTGRFVIYYRTACTNSTSVTDYASDYLLSSNSVSCALVYKVRI